MSVFLCGQISLAPVVWVLLGLCGAVGLVAIASPRTFSALTNHSSKWVDTNQLLATLDKRVDIDKYVLPFSRALGLAVLLAVGVFAYLYWRMTH